MIAPSTVSVISSSNDLSSSSATECSSSATDSVHCNKIKKQRSIRKIFPKKLTNLMIIKSTMNSRLNSICKEDKSKKSTTTTDSTLRESSSSSSYSNNNHRYDDDDDDNERMARLLDQVDFCLGVFTDDDDQSYNLIEEQNQENEEEEVEEESDPKVIKFAYQEDETWDAFCNDLPMSEEEATCN